MEIFELSARALSTALQHRELSAVEVMRACLARIESVNPKVNAIVSAVDEDAALALARAADAALDAGGAPPLTGFPHAVKDLADVAGLPTTHGSPLFADRARERPARSDSLLAARLRAAGVCFIGKTNTPEFGFGSHTFNPVFGTTRNPHDTSRSAGGSSGGAAAALATRMLPLADGSDFGGSLRNPASFCGVVGLRPSVGRVAGEALAGWAARIGVQGPMARSVDDVALLLSVLAGPDPIDPLADSTPGSAFAAPLAARDYRGARIGWTADFGAYPVEAEVAAVCESAIAKAVAAVGADLDATHPDIDGAMAVFQTQRAAAVRTLALTLERSFPGWRDVTKDTAVWNFEQGLALDMDAFHASELQRTAIRRRFVDFFASLDFLILPTVQVLPFDAEEPYVSSINGQPMPTYLDWMTSCCVISITDLPAISIPVGRSASGLPIGAQIVGPPRADRALLEFAHALESALDFDT
ncbi:MAG: amidase [Pseudomonadota bacterium]